MTGKKHDITEVSSASDSEAEPAKQPRLGKGVSGDGKDEVTEISRIKYPLTNPYPDPGRNIRFDSRIAPAKDTREDRGKSRSVQSIAHEQCTRQRRDFPNA